VERLLTLEEVAAYFPKGNGKHPTARTVTGWLHAYSVRTVTMGRQRWVPESEIERLIRQRTKVGG
jgi:hypothetical protein